MALWLDRTARRYGVRPSSLLGWPPDAWESLFLDTECADQASARQEHIAKRAKAFPVYALNG